MSGAIRNHKPKGPPAARAALSCTREGRRRKSGFLLIEVLLAVTILTIALVGIMRAIIQATSSGREVQRYTRAVQLTQQKTWEIEDRYAYTNQETSEDDEGVYEEPLEDYSWEWEIESDEDRLVYIVSVKTIWHHNKKERTYTMMSEVPMKGDEVERRSGD